MLHLVVQLAAMMAPYATLSAHPNDLTHALLPEACIAAAMFGESVPSVAGLEAGLHYVGAVQGIEQA